MMESFDRFPWPPIHPAGPQPIWDGHAFQVGPDRVRVLTFGEADSHWSGELTEMHIREAGSKHPIDVASRRLAVETVRAFACHPRPLILDVGCSAGFLLDDLKTMLPEAQVMGADFIRSVLDHIAQRHPGIPLLQFDLRNCPLPDACLDVVIALNVLEHIDDDARAMREIARILKPGGLAHVEVPAGRALFDVYDEHVGHQRRYCMAGARRLLEQAGLRVVRTRHLGSLIFPALAVVKLWNRRFSRLNAGAVAARVERQIRNTRESKAVRLLLGIETALPGVARLPFGVRCVLVGRKAG